MKKFDLTIPRVATIVRKKQPEVAPGHEHHTQIDGLGTGNTDLQLPDPDVLADRALRRAARAQKRAQKRQKRAGKSPKAGTALTVSTSDAGKGEASDTASSAGSSKSGILGGATVPQPAKVLPPGETKESYIDGQNLLRAADGLQALMMARMYDGYFDERFGDMTTIVTWGLAHMPAKKQPATQSLARNLEKLKSRWMETVPKLTKKLAKMNPKAPVQLVVQKAVELLDQELAPILYMFFIYAESIKQVRDGRFTTELNAVEVFFEDAFQLYFTGELHCSQDGKPVAVQLPTSTYKIGDVFLARVTASGLATVPGAKGPVGANALQLPFEMLDVLMLLLPLLGHEGRHNVFHDVNGLDQEIAEVVEKAIRSAHASGAFKLEKEEMQLGDQTVKTIDLIVKLFIDWLGEVDADVVGGVLFSGPAFGDNMTMSFPAMMVRDAPVSTKVKFIRTESHFTLHPQPDGSVALIFEEHPVDYVRIYIVAAALEEIGFAAVAKKLREKADFAVGDNLPSKIVYKDGGEEKSGVEIEFSTADLLAVAPVVAKAIIRTPLTAQLGKSCGDLVMWNAKRQAKVDDIADLLAQGISDLSSIKGSVFATYVGAAAAQAYLKLVSQGTDPVQAARTVNGAALKMIGQLRSLPANQCPVPVTSAPAAGAPATATSATK